MSARAKIITILCLALIGFALSVGLLFWATGITDSSMKKALSSQGIAIQALRVGRNASEQVGDVREIVYFGMDTFAHLRTHKGSVQSAFTKWDDYLQTYVGFLGKSAKATSGKERLKSFAFLENEYGKVNSGLDESIKYHQGGNEQKARAQIEDVMLGEYNKVFLPKIEDEINKDRAIAAQAEAKALNDSRFARTASVVVIPLVALFVIGISIILVRDLISSIKTLRDGAEELGAGNLDTRVNLKKRDEFWSLARSFNKMAQELQESRKELEIINAELAGFAQTVSHDLKGPLSAIMMASSTLQRMAGDPPKIASSDIVQLLDIIAVNIEKSSNLIDAILSLAEASQVPKEVLLVDISETVKRVLEERAGSIKDRGIQVKVGDFLGKVSASPTHIYQIFSNLIGNAIKHNDSRSPVIEVFYLGDNESGGHRYLVRDNGSGITPEDIDMVFLPFFKGETGETGIGLSTVERIIKVYGGDIKAYNDNGACFEFTLRDFQKE